MKQLEWDDTQANWDSNSAMMVEGLLYYQMDATLANGSVDPVREFDIEDAAAVTAEQLQKELNLKKVVVEKR